MSLYKEFMGWLTDDLVQKFARQQAAAFRLPTVQNEVSGWWEAPLSIHRLGRQDFLPHCDFLGKRDFWEIQKEGTLVLARALQHCMKKLGAPSWVMCDMVQDLQRGMEPLMWLEGDDILEALLLEATDNEPGVSQPQQKIVLS